MTFYIMHINKPNFGVFAPNRKQRNEAINSDLPQGFNVNLPGLASLDLNDGFLVSRCSAYESELLNAARTDRSVSTAN
jgi:hypothetical protein